MERDGERLSFVNEEKPTGTYEVEFSVGQSGSAGFPVLPSGIYFYRLEVYPAKGGAEGNVATKKKLLFK